MRKIWPVIAFLASNPSYTCTCFFPFFHFVTSLGLTFAFFHPLLKKMIYISPVAGKSRVLFLFVPSHSTHNSVLLHYPCPVSASKDFIHAISCLLLSPSHNEVVSCSDVFRSNFVNWKMLGSNWSAINLEVSWDDFRTLDF